MTAVDEVWHELVLHGVGGSTIDEAKQRMTFSEFTSWCEFRRLRGTLFVGNRLETGFALMATMISKATGGKAEMRDFMPHADPLTQEQQMAEGIKLFGGVTRG